MKTVRAALQTLCLFTCDLTTLLLLLLLFCTDKVYKVNETSKTTILVRPRGWHLQERHLLVDGEPVSASIFDFALHFFHNAKELLSRGTGPYFYLPKMESHLEARLWNEIFDFSQQTLGIRAGSIKATVLIETIMAAFEMEEILYELRTASCSLNAGRWDYLFSVQTRILQFTFFFPSHFDFQSP